MTFQINQRSVREVYKYKLIKEDRRTALAKCCYSYQGTALFNMMPMELRKMLYQNTFITKQFEEVIEWIKVTEIPTSYLEWAPRLRPYIGWHQRTNKPESSQHKRFIHLKRGQRQKGYHRSQRRSARGVMVSTQVIIRYIQI